MRRHTRCLTVLTWLLLISPAWAKAPTLTSLYPAGARQGTTTLVTASGSFDHWPSPGWVDGGDITVEPAAEKGTYWITVAESAPAGLRWLRLHDQEGASVLRPFFVGTLPEVNEVEPNDDPRRPQPISYDAVTINGKLGRNNDVDTFAVSLQKGQTLVASLEANRRLGSPMDGLLQVASHDGFVLAQNDDESDRDPQLVFDVPADGVYVVRTFAFPATPDSRIGFAGASTFIYRLTLTTRGFLDHACPLALAQDASASTLEAVGWNIPESSRSIEVTADGADLVRVWNPRLAGAYEVKRLPHAAIVEAEPNTLDSPQQIRPPVSVTGHIGRDGDADVYKFSALKGAKLAIKVESRALGFPLDPVLHLIDASGSVLTEVDDAGGRRTASRDPETTFTATADGDYRVLVRDLNGQGGPRSAYLLTVVPVEPDVRLTVASDRGTLTPGKPLAIKVDIDRRNGFAEPVIVEAVDLPDGVSAKPVTSEPGNKSVTLNLESSPGSKSGSFRVIGRFGKEGAGRRVADVAIEGFTEPASRAWLTVLPAGK